MGNRIVPAARPRLRSLALALAFAGPCAFGAERSLPVFDRPHRPADLAARLGLGHPSGRLRALHVRMPRRPAGTIVVENCADSGAGSLREAVANAVSGDTIDASQLACSTITLAGGLIAAVDELDIVGPGAAMLTIDAAYHGRAFYHLGAGTLRLERLSVLRGRYEGGPYYRALGGCVLSLGSVSLSEVLVTNCALRDAATDNYGTGGGGVLAYGAIAMTDSTVSSCNVVATSDDAAAAGGVFASTGLSMLRSTVSGNRVTGDGAGPVYAGGAASIQSFAAKYSTIRDNALEGYLAQGGGAIAQGDVFVLGATISGNSAGLGGAMWIDNDSADSTIVRNSTFSGNSATLGVGGIVTFGTLDIASSTIAFNASEGLYAAGLFVNGDTELQSTIVSNNTAGATERDFGGNGTVVVSGANNLIGIAFIDVPPDTIGGDPELAPLAHNGGVTMTHAPSPTSPAVDAGNNAAGYDYDQRGSGFPREIGAPADIGALELDPDRIFVDGFDS